jgi:hypothetical protein
MSIYPQDPNTDTESVDNDDGMIEFVPPADSESLVIVNPDHDGEEPIMRPIPVFADEQLPSFVLGESDIRVELTHLEMLKSAAMALLAQSKREVFIISPDLEHDRFDNDDFIDALSAFARSSRHTTTRLLLADPQLAVKDGHRLIALTRRLTSLIEIRQLHEDDVENCESLMVADDIGLLRCTNRDPWQGSLLPKGTPYAQQARSRFLEYWERASAVQDFRVLSI